MKASSLRAAVAAAIVVVMLGLISHGHYAASGDAVHYMMIAHSVAFDRDLDVANDYHDPSNILQVPPEAHARAGRGGVLRPVHDVGLPVLAAPFFAVAYKLAELSDRLPAPLRRRARLDRFIALRQLISALMILVTAALGVLFFEASLTEVNRKGVAFALALIWTLSPPILSHGYVFFTEVPSALLALLMYVRRDDVLGASPIRGGALLGLLAGTLLFVHVRNIGLVLAFVILIGWRIRNELWRATGFVITLAVAVAAKIALNFEFWGTFVTTPHERPGVWPGAAAFLSEFTTRGLGLLFDPRHGLLPSAPIYLLVPAAWIMMRRRARTQSYELMLLVVAYVVLVLMPVTNVHGWRGGWSPAARFLVPIAPFLALPISGLLLERTGRRVFVLIAAVQIVFDAVFWAHPMLFWSDGPGPAPFLEVLVGRSRAAMLPVWDHLDFHLFVISVAALSMWTVLTWVVARRPATAGVRSAGSVGHEDTKPRN